MSPTASRSLLLALTLVTLTAAQGQAGNLHGANALWRDEDQIGPAAGAAEKSAQLSTRRSTGTAPACRGEIMMFGAFAGANGQIQQLPNTLGYDSISYQAATFYARGLKFCLEGTFGVDFDLFIDRWDPVTGNFVQVASATSGAPDEVIDIGTTGGVYRARVKNFNGTGPYVLLVDGRLVDLIPLLQ